MYEYRLEILKGHDKGSVYKINGTDISIGRDSSNDLILSDTNISDFHVKLLFTGKTYLAQDLGSQKGTLVNNKKILEQQLFSGDIVNLANVYKFKFMAVQNEENHAAPPLFNTDINIPTGKKNPNKMRLIILGIFGVILLAMFVMPSETDEPIKKTDEVKPKTETELTDFEKFVAEDIDYNKNIPKGMEGLFKRADQMYKNGRREFNEENYTRALEYLKRALSYYPSHGQARYYAKLSLELMHKQAKKYLVLAKKLIYQFKYHLALKNINMVLELLKGRDTLETYKEALKMKKIVEKKLEEFK